MPNATGEPDLFYSNSIPRRPFFSSFSDFPAFWEKAGRPTALTKQRGREKK